MCMCKLAWVGALFAVCGTAGAGSGILATLTLGDGTAGIATDPSLARAYVTNQTSGTLSVIDVANRAVIATVPLAPNPRRIVVNTATHRAYISHDSSPGKLTVVDGLANVVVTTVAVGNASRSVGSNFQIGRVYVSNVADNTVSVLDTVANAVVATIPVSAGPGTATTNELLGKTYVPGTTGNAVTVIDDASNTVVKTIPVGKGPNYAAIDAVHGKVYVNNVTDHTVSVIDSATDTVVATLASGNGTTSNFGVVGTLLHRLYLPNATDGTLSIFSTDTDTLFRTVAVGTSPVDVVPDGSGGNAYVINQGSNSVSILESSTGNVVNTLPVGTSPWRGGFMLDRLLVMNQNGGNPDSLTIASGEDTIAQTDIATEFYESDFNHYFHTADEVATRLLSDGLFGASWQRTYQFWRVWNAPGAGRVPVCRFFSTAFGSKSSHFYTPFVAECQGLQTTPALAAVWELESTAVYYLALPDAGGSCGAGTAPLYRVFNNGAGGAPNHRYTADRDVRAQMVAQGWAIEGAGPDAVFACTPTLTGH